MKVEAPDGQTWTVGRQWVSHRVRLRRRDRKDDTLQGDSGATPLDSDGGGSGSGGGGFFDFDLDPGGIMVGLAVGVAIVLALFVVWPLVALAIELGCCSFSS